MPGMPACTACLVITTGSRKMMVSARLEYEQAHALKPDDSQIKQRLDAFKTAEEKIEEQVDSLFGGSRGDDRLFCIFSGIANRRG